MENETMNTQASAESAGAEPIEQIGTEQSGEAASSDASDAGFSDTDAPASEQAGAGAKGTEASAQAEGEATVQPTAEQQDAVDVNAVNAERRREAERRHAEELEEVRRKTILDTLGGVNPYTHEPMKDGRDVEEFLEMREIARRGGDPVGEYAKYHKQMERERTEAAKKEAEKNEARQRIAENRARFAADYPDVDIGTLFSDKAFLEHAGERLNTVPLSELYGEYRRAGEEAERIQNERIEARARELAAQMVANAKASPGSAVGAPQAAPNTFTTEQLKRMSREEIRENYDKIAKSYWK